MRGVSAARWIAAALLVAAAVAVTGSIASANSHRRPGCSRRCRQLGGVGGTMGECAQTASYAGSAVADARTLKIKITGSFPGTGDMVLAVVASDGDVRPPSGWRSAFDTSGPAGSAQIYYTFVGNRLPSAYSFTASKTQHMTGALLDVMGVSARSPIEGNLSGQSTPHSRLVTAPSITPSSRQSLLLFVGDTPSNVTWTGPRGMRSIFLGPYGEKAPSRLGIAVQRWHPASATGNRTAQISRAQDSSGQLIALHYPQPITCPRVKVVSHRFRPNRHGILYVRMTCRWTASCRGAFEGVDLEDHFATPKIAASDFTIPAGTTRSVPIALTRGGLRALKRHHKLAFDVFVWAYTSAHQIVVAGEARGKIRAPGR